jgi:glycosyltransferase involved in cell wall biosynthesis
MSSTNIKLHKNIRIAIIGPIIIDSKSSGGEGEKLYQKLSEEGYTTYKRSIHRKKILRLIDVVWFMITKSNKYDTIILLIFSGWSFILEYIAAIISKILNKKVIGVVHGGAFPQFYNIFPKISDHFFEKCDEIYTPSVYIKNFLLARGTYIEYLPNFIPLELFVKPQIDRIFNKRILWVRGFHDIYNPEMAIKMMAELIKLHPDSHLTMIGPDKGKMEDCIKLANYLQVENRINILGFVPNNELISHFHNADVYINTTRYESFGVALMEAAGTALPIVSTNVGEIPFLWNDSFNILLCDDGDFLKMSKHVSTLFEDTILRNKIAENGLELTRNYSWPIIKMEWNKILQK